MKRETITDKLKSLDTARYTIKQMHDMTGAAQSTIRRLCNELRIPYKSALNFVCLHCKGEFEATSWNQKTCKSEPCQERERTLRNKRNQDWQSTNRGKVKPRHGGGRCDRCGQKRKLVTNLCRPCVQYLDAHYGDGYIQFSR